MSRVQAGDGLDSRALYLRLLGFVRPYWRVFAIALLAMIVLALTEPALPALLKPLLDGSFVEKDPKMIRLMPLLLVLLYLVRGTAGFISTVALNWVAHKVVMDIRNQMFRKLLDLPTPFYDANASGLLISKVTYDVTNVTSAATNVLLVLVRDSLAVIGLMAWMFYLEWKLSLIFFIAAPLIVLVVKFISARLRHLARTLQRAMGDLTHVLEETILGNKVVKVFGGQDYEQRRFAEVINQVRRYHMKMVTVSAANVPAVQFIAAIALATIVYIASLQSAADEITVGTFVSLFGAMAMLFSPIKRLTSINEQLQRGLAAAESAFGLLDQTSEDDSGSEPLDRAEGRIDIQGVGFRYAPEGPEVLRDIDLSIRPGEVVALVGPSGSGKTSLAALLARFYQPTRGRILLDGVDILALPLRDLRRQIALVSQDVVLFNDTLGANIAYGEMAGVDGARLLAAAEAAHAREFIEQMPEGNETLIGENGVRLSGGQRQRLAIARALLKDAPVLILDEATSALDTQSERHVQAALENLERDRTTLVIAHRLSTVENADRIVVMDQGRIVEQGPHKQLLQQGGLYSELYRTQFQHREPAADDV